MKREGVVNSAKTKPFKRPTKTSCDIAHAEKTIRDCPQGRARVKKPNKKAGKALSFSMSKVRDWLTLASLFEKNFCPG